MKKHQRKGVLLFCCIALLAMIVFGYWLVFVQLPTAIVMPYRYNIAEHKEVPVERMYAQLKFTDSTHVHILTYDGLRQDAVWLRTRGAKATIVCLHGIGACKELMLPLAGVFLEAGFNVLLLDIRAQGASEGAVMTYGYRERYDVQAAVRSLINQSPEEAVGISGVSLGGAIALQAMEVTPELQCGIVMSTFASMRDVVHLYAARTAGFRIDLIADLAMLGAEGIAHFQVDSVQPMLSASRLKEPVLFIHGDADLHIPEDNGRKNYLACASPGKEWFTVKGANHNNVLEKGATRLQEMLSDFAKKHLSSK